MIIALASLIVALLLIGIILPSPTSGAAIFGSTGSFVQASDGSLVNLSMAQQIRQDGAKVILDLPNGNQVFLPFATSAIASAFLTGLTTFATSQFALLTLRSITPATGVNGTTISAVLVGTGFQYDLSGATYLGTGSIKIGGNTSTNVFVNSNTILLSFTAPAPGTYDVVYTPNVGAAVTLVGAWIST